MVVKMKNEADEEGCLNGREHRFKACKAEADWLKECGREDDWTRARVSSVGSDAKNRRSRAKQVDECFQVLLSDAEGDAFGVMI